MARAVMVLHAAHVIDDNRHRNFGERRQQVGQVARVDPQLQVPSQLGHRGQQRLHLFERDAILIVGLAVAAEFVCPQAAHAGRVPLLQSRCIKFGAADGDAAQP